MIYLRSQIRLIAGFLVLLAARPTTEVQDVLIEGQNGDDLEAQELNFKPQYVHVSLGDKFVTKTYGWNGIEYSDHNTHSNYGHGGGGWGWNGQGTVYYDSKDKKIKYSRNVTFSFKCFSFFGKTPNKRIKFFLIVYFCNLM